MLNVDGEKLGKEDVKTQEPEKRSMEFAFH